MTWAARVALSLAAIALAAATLASGLDRLSAQRPRAASLTPDFAKARAWRVLAAQSLTRRDAQAVGLAGFAIASDPYEQRNTSLLAAAKLASGRREEAGQAFAAADLLGQRDVLVHAYFFDTAIASGDAKRAARRLDTLLKVRPRLAANGYFFAALEQSKNGREVLAYRLRRDPVWSDAYLTGFGAADESLQNRAQYLAAHGASLRLGCERTSPMLVELARRGMRANALKLAQAQCPEKARGGLVEDPGFESVGSEAPIGWRRHTSGDLRIALVGAADKSVEVQNRSPSSRLVLSQSVAIAPGEYHLFASVVSGGSDTLLASLDCGTPVRPSGRGGGLGRGQLVVAPSCENLVLGIWVKPGSGSVRFDNFRIAPVGAEPD